ncbi:hypothetical protein ScPMuIL_005417 [Solemya velum]
MKTLLALLTIAVVAVVCFQTKEEQQKSCVSTFDKCFDDCLANILEGYFDECIDVCLLEGRTCLRAPLWED